MTAPSFKTPAHRFHQGSRTVFAFAMDLATLDKLLPDRVDDRLVQGANRPLTKSHATNIRNYLAEKGNWLLGPLMLGIGPEAVDFVPDASTSSVGYLTLHPQHTDSLKMFDGQHRRRAIRELLRDLHGDMLFHSSEWHDRLLQAAVPVMLYVEGNMEALRQMFADAARTRPVEKNAVTRFDERDPFNLAAKYLARHSELFGGRVEMERAMVPGSSECIVAINQLANAVKAAELGISPKVAALRKSSLLDVDDLCEHGMEWADDFMPSARDEYNDLTAGNLDQAEIPELRKETLVFNAIHIRVFAGCYFEWTRGHGSEDRGHWNTLAESIRGSSFQVGDPHSVPVKTGLMPEGSSTPRGRRQDWHRAVDYLVNQADTASTANSSEEGGTA